jgi:hypothetical protein
VGRELVLTSAEDGASLRMTCPDQSWGSITVEARGNGFLISAPVYVYMAPSLPKFLAEVEAAGATREVMTWETLEGELRFEAKRDPLGHMFITYHLRSSDIGSNRWWSFTGRIVLELGAMPELQNLATRFWNAAT